MADTAVDTLAQYGRSFQLKVISALLFDRAFLQQVFDLILPDYFESQANTWIVKTILTHFEKYKNVPTADVFRTEMIDMTDAALTTAIRESLREVRTFREASDLDYVKNSVIEFCKNQRIKTALLESVDLLQGGRYDQILKTMTTAFNAGSDRDVGHEYDDLITRYSEGARRVIPTPWPVLNDIMGNGLGNGELGLVVAPAGGAKSWVLVNMAIPALKMGKRVIYYTLELNQYYVARRFDAHFINVPFGELNLDLHGDRIREYIDNLPGELIVKYYPTKAAAVSTLTAHMEKCIAQGKPPDLVIVDYADNLRAATKGEKRLELNDIYEDLRGVAGVYDIPIWTASQANRSSTEEDVIEGNKVAESFNKIMICDFIVSIARKTNDKIGGTARWYVIKNRFGPDGITFPSRMNTFTGHIDVFEPNSSIGKSLSNDMSNEKATKGAIRSRLQLLKQESN